MRVCAVSFTPGILAHAALRSAKIPTPEISLVTTLEQLLLETPSPPRSPWQLFYGGAHRMRRQWWSRRACRLPRPVISLGNLHWGGSGKTPMTAAVAAHLHAGGHRVAILSRGYKSQGEGIRIVSDGGGPLLGPRVAGDEPVLLAGLLPGVAVVVGPDRYLAGRHALERLDKPPDIFVLDDGFSHLPLERDLDLLVFPAADPFAGGRLWPAGRLREPLASSQRAHAAILTGGVDPEAGARLGAALRPHGFAGASFTAQSILGAPRTLQGEEIEKGTPVMAVSAIARPLEFLDTVRKLGFQVADHLSFPDHHPYPDASLEKISQRFRSCEARAVLTTGKDRVKLHGRLDLPLAEVPLRAQPEERFFSWLDEQLREIEKQPPQGVS